MDSPFHSSTFWIVGFCDNWTEIRLSTFVLTNATTPRIRGEMVSCLLSQTDTCNGGFGAAFVAGLLEPVSTLSPPIVSLLNVNLPENAVPESVVNQALDLHIPELGGVLLLAIQSSELRGWRFEDGAIATTTTEDLSAHVQAVREQLDQLRQRVMEHITTPGDDSGTVH